MSTPEEEKKLAEAWVERTFRFDSSNFTLIDRSCVEHTYLSGLEVGKKIGRKEAGVEILGQVIMKGTAFMNVGTNLDPCIAHGITHKDLHEIIREVCK